MRRIFITILITATAALIVFTSRQSLPIGESDVFAQQKSAVGVRIMANSEHLPISKWYETQDFQKQGSPTYTQVNGYDAMRDGRTVYVNAINVICPQVKDSVYCLTGTVNNCAYARECGTNETGNPNFYTNVYVLSLSDESPDAQNIFSQILKNWHFNTNINVNHICAYSSDITACRTALGGEKGIAELQIKLRRDARRISDVVFVQDILNRYYTAKGNYPTLKAGTYLESQTISKWPSWQETLGAELRITMPNDPINSFYPFEQCPATNQSCYCNGYDAQTCWDNKSRLFNGKRDVKAGLANENNFEYTVGTGANAVVKTANLTNALVYYYKSSSNGASYEFNASKWETPYVGRESVEKIQASHSASNVKPIIANIGAVKMSPNTEKTVEVQAYDYNAFTGKIIWATPEIVGANCIASAELLPNTQSADKLYGDKFISYKNLKITSGANICNGKINLKVSDDGIINVSDSAMESDLYVVNVAINNQLPSYPSGIKTYSAQTVVGYPWSYSIKASDAEDKILTYKIIGGQSWLSFEGGGTQKNSADGVKISGTPNVAGVYNFSIEAKDSKGGSASLAIALTVTNKNPVITDFPTDAEKHINENFSYDVKATDADGHTAAYSMTCTPEVNCGNILKIDSASGKIISPDNFKIADYGIYNFTVTASDGYGGSASKNFKITITPSCGNNVVENWASGGIVEQCESAGNGTGVNDQYGCASCKWTGGYCGDGVLKGSEQCEAGGKGTGVNDQYSCASCKWSGGWCGDGKVNGSEECEDGNLTNDDGCNNNCTCHPSTLDLVFVLDDTGSMGSSIASLKDNVIAISNQLKETGIDVNFGLVVFNDVTSDTCAVAITHLVPFTSNVDDIKNELDKVTPNCGGDEPELAYDGLMYSVNNFSYRSGPIHKKISILITDASAKKGVASSEKIVKDAYISKNIEIIGILGKYPIDNNSYTALIESTGGESYKFDKGNQVGDLILGALTTCK